MSTQTTKYHLVKPADNETADIAVINSNMDAIDAQLKAASDAATEASTDLAAQAANYVRQPGYGVTSGGTMAYTLTLIPSPTAYIDGMGIAIKMNAANTGASTINVNGLGTKALKDPNGNDFASGTLKQNTIYSFKYDSVNGNFILQGKGGGGNAVAGDLLSGKTATVDSGQITGSMPNIGQVIKTPSTANQTIQVGYHDGTGYVLGDADLVATNIKNGINIFGVTGTFANDATAGAGDILNSKTAYSGSTKLTGSMPNNGAVTITPSTVNQTIVAGYHNGSGYVAGDADLIASNILTGVNIFGVTGTVIPVSSTPHNTQIYSTPGSYTFTVPANVTQITFMAGAGGGGGGGGWYYSAAGGGGGGAYISVLTVTPGQQIAVVVGAGGTGGSRDVGGTGGNSSVAGYTAYGGTGGQGGVNNSSSTRTGGVGGAGGGYGGYGGNGGSACGASAGGDGGSGGGIGGTAGAGGNSDNGYSGGIAGLGGGGGGGGGVLIVW
jgi:hypothetical protein